MSYLILFYNENWKKSAEIDVDSEIRHSTWSWSREWQSKAKEFQHNNHKSSQLAPDKKKDIPNTTVDTQQHNTTLKQLKWLPAVDKHWLEVEQQQLLALQQPQQRFEQPQQIDQQEQEQNTQQQQQGNGNTESTIT
jgi:hypothetical protein